MKIYFNPISNRSTYFNGHSEVRYNEIIRSALNCISNHPDMNADFETISKVAGIPVSKIVEIISKPENCYLYNLYRKTVENKRDIQSANGKFISDNRYLQCIDRSAIYAIFEDTIKHRKKLDCDKIKQEYGLTESDLNTMLFEYAVILQRQLEIYQKDKSTNNKKDSN